jgi:rhodanese-related sulfurtransferase
MAREDDNGPGNISPRHGSRRGVLVLSVAGLGAAAALGARWFNVFSENTTDALTPLAAHAAAASGGILLVDIRRPEEWVQTGIGEHAIALDMRRGDFLEALLARAGGDAARPIALICARGVRSRHLSARLATAGFSRVVDVPEGMLGSGAGPGWLRRGLPVVVAQ